MAVLIGFLTLGVMLVILKRINYAIRLLNQTSSPEDEVLKEEMAQKLDRMIVEVQNIIP